MNVVPCRLAAVALLAVSTTVNAQTCRLVCDINKAPIPIGSNPDGGRRVLPGGRRNHNFIKCGQHWYFSAYTCKEGRELWKTDGSAAGTVLVKDIVPGALGSNPGGFLCCRGGKDQDLLLFHATTPAAGTELWRSDGSATGTVMVKDIHPGAASGIRGDEFPAECLGVTGFLFAASDGANGVELWLSDGTTSGTLLVKDINPGGASSFPDDLKLRPDGSDVLFSADDGTSGVELWKSDGKSATTVRVKDISAGAPSSSPHGFCNVNRMTVFAATEPGTGTELYSTDGTPAGTLLLKDIRAGRRSGAPDLTYAELVNNVLHFTANNGLDGPELWKSDATAAGTVIAANVNPMPGRGSSPTEFCGVGNDLFFRATVDKGEELYKYANGVASIVKDINRGGIGSVPSSLTAVGNKVWFRADDGSKGRETWRSDGTALGTDLLKDLVLGPRGDDSQWAGVVNANRVFFSQAEYVSSDPNLPNQRELYVTDMTSQGTRLFKDIEPGTGTASGLPPPPRLPLDFTAGPIMFMGTAITKFGREPCRIEPASGRCTPIDLRPGSGGSDPAEWTACGDKVYCRANDGVTGFELWEWDVSSQPPTRRRHDIRSGRLGSIPSRLVCCDNKLFFSADDGSTGQELWMIDPSAADATRKPVLVKDIRAGRFGSFIRELTYCKDRVFFTASDGVHGTELWESDGTPAGTRMVVDLRSGSFGSFPTRLTCCPDASGRFRLFFSANDGVNGTELHVYDGSTATLVRNIRAGSGSSFPSELSCCDGRVYFAANDGSNGSEPWVTDGTAAGTVMLKDIHPGNSSSFARDFTCCGGKVFFSALDATPITGTGFELYSTDGTPAGTILVKDINSGVDSSTPSSIKKIGDRIYFSADDGRRGAELWCSDGTVAGTRLVCDVNLGRESSNPYGLACFCGDLYFVAYTPKHGYELRVLDKPGAMVEVVGQGCSGIELMASGPPLIGKTFHLEGRCAPKGNTHVGVTFFLLKPSRPPLHVPVLFDRCCWGWLGLINPAWVSTTERWKSAAIAIPNDRRLSGLPLFYQTYYVDLRTVTPVKTSNGLLLTTGG